MIIAMADKMTPTAPPLVSSPPRAADDGYASSVISRSSSGVGRISQTGRSG